MIRNIFTIILLGFIPFSAFSQELPYKMQMHIHGHSHHNGAEKPASMQWHSSFAKNTNTDILWWTEHSQLFDQSVPMLFPLDSAYLDTTLSVFNIPVGQISTVNEGKIILKSSISGGTGTASINNKRLKFKLISDSAAVNYQRFKYRPRTEGGAKLSSFLLSRPLTSNVILELEMERGNLYSNANFEIIVDLSWHSEDSIQRLQKIIYTFSNGAVDSKFLLNPNTLIVSVASPILTRTMFQLNISEDALLLPNGKDNSITDITFSINAKKGFGGLVTIGKIKLLSQNTDSANQIESLKQFSTNYGNQYSIIENVGVEYSPKKEGNQTVHLNGFIPRTNYKTYLYLADSASTSDPAFFTNRIHAQGGIASYNHLFFDRPAGAQYLFSEAIQNSKTNYEVNKLLGNKAHNTDILEVGYLYRGGLDLKHHLSAWDKLTANGLFLYGNGVSDAHGDEWEETKLPNPFVTWVWSNSSESDSLIAAMKKGRMFFGNSFRFNGTIDFSVGSLKMGYRGNSVARYGNLKLNLSGLPDSAKIYLVQGKIQPGLEVLYLKNDLININDTITIDLTQPCFIRIEVYQKDNTPLVFSNPITITGEGVNRLQTSFKKTGRRQSCAGLEYGRIAATITNGIPPYKVNWSNRDTTLLIENLVEGNYTCRVIDSEGNIDSNTTTILKVDTIPHTNRFYNEGISDSSATIKWQPIIGAQKYKIYYTCPLGTDSIIVKDTTHVLKDLAPFTKYFWKIKTICDTNFVDQYSYSKWSNFTTLKTCEPPGNVYLIKSDSTKLTIGWNLFSGADTYKFLWKPINSGIWNYIQINNPLDSLRILFGLKSAEAYTIKMRSMCGSGYTSYSAFTDIDTFQTKAICPSIDSLRLIYFSDRAAKFKWTPVPQANHYKLRWKLKSTDSWKEMILTNPLDSIKTIYNLLADSIYEAGIMVYCDSGSSYSSIFSPITSFRLLKDPLRVYGQGISASVSPNIAYTNSYGTFKISCIVNADSIQPGGGIKLRFIKGFGKPQFWNPQKFNYVKAETSNLTSEVLITGVTRIDSLSSWDYEYNGYVLSLKVQKKSLIKGDTVIITYGANPPTGQLTTPKGRFLDSIKVAYDLSGDGIYSEIAEFPTIDILSGGPNKLRAYLPSNSIVNTICQLKIVTLDSFYNRAISYTGNILLTSSDPAATMPSNVFMTAADSGIINLEVIFKTKGVQTINLIADGQIPINNQNIITNPVLVSDTIENKIFWGDLHSHSNNSYDGIGTGSFNYAEKISCLDFYALTDHCSGKVFGLSSGLNTNEWSEIKQLNINYYKPNKFVTLFAYEFTANAPSGHHNIFFKADNSQIPGIPLLKYLEYKSIKKVWEQKDLLLSGLDFFSVPHHTGISFSNGVPGPVVSFGKDFQDSLYRPLIEIFSDHGLSEEYNPVHDLSYENFDPTRSSTNGPYYAQDAWVAGEHLGTIASSDDHSAMPGHSGLTAVYAPELTRDAIFDALKNKHTYATTGNRMILNFEVNNSRMGSTGYTNPSDYNNVKFEVHGTSELEFIEILKWDGTYKNNHPFFKSIYKDIYPGINSSKIIRDCNNFDSSAVSIYYMRVKEKKKQYNFHSEREIESWGWSSPVWIKKCDTCSVTNPPLTVGISIRSTDTIICPGETITFTATPINGGTNPIFQWKKNNANVGGDSAFFVSSELKDLDEIVCVITSNVNCLAFDTVASELIKISTLKAPVILSQPLNDTVCMGATVNFNIVAEDSSNFQWQFKKAGTAKWTNLSDTNNINNSKTNSVQIKSVGDWMDGNLYRCIVNNNCLSNTSNNAMLLVSGIPENRREENLVKESVSLKWNMEPLAEGYKIGFKKETEVKWKFVQVNSISDSLKLEMLESSAYQWKISSKCNGVWSPFSSLRSFNINCGIPSLNEVTKVEDKSAIIQWKLIPGSDNYEIGYLHNNEWVYGNITTDTFYILNGLNPKTSYSWKVRANCGAIGWTGYSSIGNFTTLETCFPPDSIKISVLNNNVEIRWINRSIYSEISLKYKKIDSIGWNYLLLDTTLNNYNISGLDYNSTYLTGLEEICPVGYYSDSIISIPDTFQTLPFCSFPDNLQADSLTNSSLLLKWTMTNAYKIELQNRKGGDSLWNTIFIDSGLNELKFFGLESNTNYQFKIRSICDSISSISEFSDTLNILTRDICQSIDSLFPFNISNRSCSFSWNPIAGPNHYVIQWKLIGSNAWEEFRITNPTDSTITINNLLPDSTYEAKIKVLCDSSEYYTSVFSKISMVKLKKTCLPPGNHFSLNLNSSKVTIGWDRFDGSISYKLLWKPLISGTWNYFQINNPTDSLITLYELTPGEDYEFKMRSFCNNDYNSYSNYSLPDTFRTKDLCSSIDTIELVTVSEKTAELKWKPVPGANYYMINWKLQSANNWNGVKIANPLDSIKKLYDLQADSLYHVRIKVFCDTGKNYSSEFSPLTSFRLKKLCEPPFNPEVVNLNPEKATIKWVPAIGANYYKIHWKSIDSIKWNGIQINNPLDTAHTLYGLIPGNYYEIKMRSLCNDTFNLFSEFSSIDTFLTKTTCPSILSLDLLKFSEETSTLGWKPIPEAHHYRLNWKLQSAATWNGVEIINPIDSIKTLYGLLPDSIYVARIKVFCDSTKSYSSQFSSVITFQTKTTCPAIDSLKLLYFTDKTVKLGWNPIPGANHNRLNWKLQSATTWNGVEITNPLDSIKMLYGLLPDSVYEARMKVFCDSTNYSGSDFSKILSFKLKKECFPPANFRILNSDTSTASLGWNIFDGAASYRLLWKLSGSQNWNGAQINNPLDSFKIIEGLQKDTFFDFKIRSFCGADWNNYSDFSEILMLNTGVLFKSFLQQSNELIDPAEIKESGKDFQNIVSTAKKGKILIYPNPGFGVLYLSGLENDVKIKLYDLAGREINYYSIQNQQKNSIITFLDGIKGIFNLKITSADGTEENRLILIL